MSCSGVLRHYWGQWRAIAGSRQRRDGVRFGFRKISQPPEEPSASRRALGGQSIKTMGREKGSGMSGTCREGGMDNKGRRFQKSLTRRPKKWPLDLPARGPIGTAVSAVSRTPCVWTPEGGNRVVREGAKTV